MAGLFSDGFLDRVRAANDVVEIIGAAVPLKRAGANFVALCPFHKEKSPSFNVNPQRQIFHCFGCHKGGDIFTFVREFEGVDFPEAVRRLADRAKIPLEHESGIAESPARHIKEQLLQIHEQLTQRWQNALATEAAGKTAREYLKRRGVSEEMVKLFRLGSAPDAWDDTVNWAKSKGLEPGLVERAGLIVRKEGSDQYYDRFRGRLMFPICDEQGRVIGFSGRILSGDEKVAKYVNSPETPIFSKSKVIFGLDKSKRALLDSAQALVCEGQLDLIACFQGGLQNVVAPQGTAFTADHARILKRYVSEVVLCFDSDEAGQNAAIRSLDHLLAAGLAVRVSTLPAPHDPDTFVKEFGGTELKTLIHAAPGFFDFYLQRLCAAEDLATDKGRMNVLRGMADAIHKTNNSVLVDKYAQRTALRLGVAPDAVRAEFKKLGHARRAPEPVAETESVTAPVQPPSPQEYWLIKLLLLHEELVPWAASVVDATWLQHDVARDIVTRRLAAHRSGTWTGLGAFLDGTERPDIQSIITEVTAVNRELANAKVMLAEVAQRLRNQWIDRQLTDLRNRAAHPDTSEELRVDLLRQQQELRLGKQQPLPPIG